MKDVIDDLRRALPSPKVKVLDVNTGITLELGIGGKSGALVTSVDGPAAANFVSGLQVDGWRGLKWACATCISCVALVRSYSGF